jgi:PKD repeat protein
MLRYGYNLPYGDSFYKDLPFYAEPLSGSAPVVIKFYAGTPSGYTCKWNFGDGRSSTEKNPYHIYTMAGRYDVTCVFTNDLGVEYVCTRDNYITIYGDSTELISSKPDFCFKLALKQSQGSGISPITGVWVWPALVASTAKGFNSVNENITLVINAENMTPYRIGIPECWVDREGDYDQSEIQCSVMPAELFSTSGIDKNVRHVETHIQLQSWDEKNYRNKEGYDSEGLKNGQQLTIEGYRGGEKVVPETSLLQINKDGDFAFLKELEAKRFQINFKFATSSFRVPRIEVITQEMANRTPVNTNVFPQMGYHREFSVPDLWLSCNDPGSNTNRADGKLFEGDVVYIEDPVGTLKAMSTTGLSGSLAYSIGDFAVIGWVYGDATLFKCQVLGGGDFEIVVAGDKIIVSDGVDSFYTDIVSSGWIMIAVTRDETDINVFVNGTLVKTYGFSALRIYGGDTEVSGSLFDIRRYPIQISDNAIGYYYSNTLEFLP